MNDRENIVYVEAAVDRLRRYLPQADWWSLAYAAELARRSLEVSGLVTSLALEMLEDLLPQEISDNIKHTADLVIDAQRPFVGYGQSIGRAQVEGRDPIVLPLLRYDLLVLLDTVVVAWRTLWDIWEQRPFLTHAQLKNPRIWEISQKMLTSGERLAAIAPKQPYGPPDVSPAVVTAPPARSRGGGILWAMAAAGIVGAIGVALWRH